MTAPRHDHTDAQPVIDHIHALQAAGAGLLAIGKAAGIHPSTVGKIGRGWRATVHVDTAEAVLAVTADQAIKGRPGRPRIPDPTPPWGEVRRKIVQLHQLGVAPDTIATDLDLPLERIAHALVGTGGPRARSKAWPPAGRVA